MLFLARQEQENYLAQIIAKQPTIIFELRL
jgi:hypothetical protein